jgi:alpha-tubulin suppressor-like RCC1 family protein
MKSGLKLARTMIFTYLLGSLQVNCFRTPLDDYTRIPSTTVSAQRDASASETEDAIETSSSTSVDANSPTSTRILAAGAFHTCAIRSGNVLCWGANTEGQLGNGTELSSTQPSRVIGLPGTASAVTAGFSHSCAIANGAAYCWGHNATGELGNGSAAHSLSATLVKGLKPGPGDIVAGPLHTCALNHGSVWCWGENRSAQLGSNSGAYSANPVEVQGLPTGIRMIAVGDSHTCGATSSEVWCWGDNTFGQLGVPLSGGQVASATPVLVPGFSEPIGGLVAGRFFTCAIVNGSVRCWGTDVPGTHAASSGASISFPGSIHILAARMLHLCGVLFVTSDLMCVGDNAYGDLGDDSLNPTETPVHVSGNFGDIQALVVGDYHACAFGTSAIWCWGRNLEGQLGDGTNTDSHVPVRVVNLSP